MIVEEVGGPNWWQGMSSNPHVCYQCNPEDYPEMPKFHRLCARCGQLIFTPEEDDWRNQAMIVCNPCYTDIFEQH